MAYYLIDLACLALYFNLKKKGLSVQPIFT